MARSRSAGPVGRVTWSLALVTAAAFGTARAPAWGAGGPARPGFVTAQEAESGTVSDLLVLRFDGTLAGEAGEMPTESSGVAFAPGVTGQGALLGTSNRLSYASAGNIDAREGTFECWVKPAWAGGDGRSHWFLRYGVGGGLLIGKDGAGNLRLILNRFGVHPGGEVGVAWNVRTWEPDRWRHVAFTWSDTAKRLQLFIDGTLVATQTFTIALPAIPDTTIQVGRDGEEYAEAVLDTLRVSDGARSARDIAQRMVEGLTIASWSLSPAPGAIQLWPGWSWWERPDLVAVTSAGTLTLPWTVATWTTSNPDVARFDEDTGRIVAVGPGLAVLTGTLGGSSASLAIEVVAPVLPPREEPIDTFLATPAAGHLYRMPVAILRYFPTTDGVRLDRGLCGQDTLLTDIVAKANRVERQHKFMLEEGSRFRGYANPAAPPALGYEVVKILTVFEDVPPGLPAGTGAYFPDYNQILSRFDARDLVERLGVKEFWIWHYHYGRLVPNESNMSSAVTGDVSNSYRTTDDQPVFSRTYVTYGLNFGRDANEATHNHGHQQEAILSYVNRRQDGHVTLFRDLFVGAVGGTFAQGRCGDTHHPPNAAHDYDYDNPTLVLSDIEDWTPAHTGAQKPVNNTTWGGLAYGWPGGTPPPGKTEAQWYIYWMQAFPGRQSAIPYDARHLGNWWHFTGDWDAAIRHGLGLHEPGACTYAVSTTSLTVPGSGGSASVAVTAPAGCAWIASSNWPEWIGTGTSGGTGPGTVSVTVAASPGGARRTGSVAIAGHLVTITQSADADLASLRLTRTQLSGCLRTTGKVTLTQAAPAGGLVVSLRSDNANAIVPATLAFKAGVISRTFPILTTAVPADEGATITASVPGRTLSALLTLTPMHPKSVVLTPNPVVGGSPVSGTVTLECPAGPGDITVRLASSKPAIAAPTLASVTVPAGATAGPFDVTTTPVALVTRPAIKATANGVTKSKTLVVNSAP